MNARNIWILTPCYKDVASFLKLREECRSAVPGSRMQFILIDDTAGTDHEIEKLNGLNDVRVVTPPFNLGHQRAIVFGLRSTLDQIASEDIVVTMDSDGEDKPNHIPRLIAALSNDPQMPQMILARRTRRHVSLKFRLLYSCFVIMFRVLTGQVLKTGNFAVYSGFTARLIADHSFLDLCYSSALVNLKIPVTYIPCERGRRYYDVSKMGYFNLLVHGFRMLMPFIDKIAVRALIGCGLIAALSLATGLGLFAVQFLNYNVHISSIITSFAISVFMIVSASTFLLMFTIFSQSQSIVLSKLETKQWKNIKRVS